MPSYFLAPFCFSSPQIIGVKVYHRQTNRQTNKFFDTIYGGMWIFSFSLICYLPTRFACRGIINQMCCSLTCTIIISLAIYSNKKTWKKYNVLPNNLFTDLHNLPVVDSNWGPKLTSTFSFFTQFFYYYLPFSGIAPCVGTTGSGT